MRFLQAGFKIRQLMIAVAISALVLTPFAWVSRESRWPLFVAVLTVAPMLMILGSAFLLDRVAGGQSELRPRTRKTAPLPPLLRFLTGSEPPHRR